MLLSKIKKIILIFSIASTSLFSIAHASSLYNAYQGLYASFGGGATYANKLFQPNGTPNQAVRCGFLGAGGNIFLGDQMTPYVAPEIGFNYFSFGSNGGVSILSLNGKFTLPVATSFSLFARLGLGYGELTTRMSGTTTTNGFVPAFGLGVGYGITSQWMLSFEANGALFPQDTVNGNGIMGGLTVAGTRYFAQ